MTRRENHSANTELCIIWQKSDNDNDNEVYQCLVTIGAILVAIWIILVTEST